ncbi:hypothetical protein SAMN07250955_104231 [Arboricoccus pini]|uniref:DUF1178 family protein n=1 Tax=Arboricoccus pini TaxID=1963835 RepID=A0A212QZW6_9PROT|nr:DUF1178 family protein [Arboricoccus pini]SNB65283.1 hypothetical protein SAMN07250955_104231 [Arboricoccus pini]
MIRFSLACEREHEFEGWFKSNAGFDQQVAVGGIECPFCGSSQIRKALMAPAIAKRTRRDDQDAPPTSSGAATSLPSPTSAPPAAQLAAAVHLVRALHKHIEANLENVGERFAEEARRIHYGEAEERGIYGQASHSDVEALVDEGIAVKLIPPLPEFDS